MKRFNRKDIPSMTGAELVERYNYHRDYVNRWEETKSVKYHQNNRNLIDAELKSRDVSEGITYYNAPGYTCEWIVIDKKIAELKNNIKRNEELIIKENHYQAYGMVEMYERLNAEYNKQLTYLQSI